jgi:hypothetical protein
MSKNQVFRNIILFFVVFLLNYNVSAQISAGVGGGMSWSRVSFSPGRPQVYINTYQGRFIFRYVSEPHCGLQIEANYTQRGWKELSLYTGKSYQRITDYFEMPILTHFYFGKKTHFFVNAGLILSYALKANESIKNSTSEITQKYEFNPDLDKRYEYGITGGGGFEHRFGFGTIGIEGRYYFGMTNILKLEDAKVTDYSRNKVITVSLYYLVNFGKPL